MPINISGIDLTPEEIELFMEALCQLARKDFGFFRILTHPEMLTNWWTRDVAYELQQFYYDLIAGRRPKLAIQAPPQHGKSFAAEDFVAWFSGKEPNKNTIFASYSAELGVRTNRHLKRIMEDPRYRQIFPGTMIGLDGWQCNSDHIEFCHAAGSFRNTTIESAVTGFGLHLGLVDDPVKGRNEANSKSIRDSTWNWFTDDFYPRFADDGALLAIMTRWHVDDLIGRMIEKFGEWDAKKNPQGINLLRYPAIAERDTDYRKKGEALFPQLKSLEFLLERKAVLSQSSWESQYQQHPFKVGGGALPIDKLKIIPVFDRSKVIASIRYWDKAGTENNDDASYTAGCLMHRLKDSDPAHVIEHIARGQWRAYDREQQILQCARSDASRYANYEVIVEREPGSSGKESAENTIRNLAGFRAREDRVTGAKQARADPFVAQVQGGNVGLVAGDYVGPFRDECEPWPDGQHDDQVDAAAGAFSWLVKALSYNTDYSSWL